MSPKSAHGYGPLLRLSLESIIGGVIIILFLHYFMPYAEHPRILNTVGLFMDMIGVTYVAYDIFPFAGVEEYDENDAKRSGIETPEYKTFKRGHTSKGLRVVVIGFFFQILSYWVEDITAFLP